ncbi:E3 ubiquitin protein ligase DRIP2-like isoform X2 [Zingiber officinale]|uniref:E3 ubiquitin protein ligase DRIP2-like isoform X2 n=1 Tax=Zingiber officinale TaxID=94328 RepID=UPI001C4B7E00|nr:E3 ubiquitin protein ligase DRIP2-like isoform X2 [Zingiber officinale]
MEDAGVAALGASKVVKVRREVLAACMKCPICQKLLRDATTIPECLHTFCRKCITEKLNDEEIDYCPVCNISLGAVPMEKLRADNNLQDIRETIFPSKRRKAELPEKAPTTVSPVKIKERSLSSLVVNTPNVATQMSSTGRQIKAVTRRTVIVHDRSSWADESSNKDNYFDKHVQKPSSNVRMSNETDRSSKVSQNRKQPHPSLESSNHTLYEGKDRSGGFKENVDIWNSLNCLVEAANRTESFRSVPESPDAETEGLSKKERVKVHPHKFKVTEQTDNSSMPQVIPKESRLQRVKRRRKEPTASAQTSFDSGSSPCVGRNPIWFSLVPSVEQTEDSQFQQLSSNYIKIKDGSMPVSFIHKYLVKKLNLENEAVLEITCLGEPVSPAMSMNKLVEQWLRERSLQRLQATVEASAKEFVMVLAYGRRKVSENE